MVSGFASLGKPRTRENVAKGTKDNGFDTFFVQNLSKQYLVWLEFPMSRNPYPVRVWSLL